MSIKDTLLLQQREREQKFLERYIPRTIPQLPLESDLIKVIIGPRRAGKSFYALHTLQQAGSFGYVNFDDEKLIQVHNYDEIVDAVKDIYHASKYLLLDEIQNLPRWELFVNRLQRQGHKLIITGSNAHLLSRELATHLTGRHQPIILFPFSFREYLLLEARKLTQSEIKIAFGRYSAEGGYPEVVLKKMNGKEYLETLFNAILYKDIIKRYRLRSVQGMEDLARYLLANFAKEYSYTTLSQVTRCRSVHTIEKYLHYLEEAFLFFPLYRFSFKVKEQLRSPKKIYCIDNGFIQSKVFTANLELGRLYENLVAIELKKAELQGKIRCYYWKSLQQEEVDFVVTSGQAIQSLIQVCYDLSEPKTKEREVRALVKASQELRCQELLLLSADKEGREEINWFGARFAIQFIPLWKWLLKR